MKKIFLSAGIPEPGRKYSETINKFAIAEAVMAFTRVCAENNLPFYFGGQPAITPLVWSVLKNYSASANEQVTIYQSSYFKDKTPPEVGYFDKIKWTDFNEDRGKSLDIMRNKMLEEDTSVAIFIGGSDGVEIEFEQIKRLHPNLVVIPFSSTGGAAKAIYDRMNLHNNDFSGSFAYYQIMKNLLLK